MGNTGLIINAVFSLLVTLLGTRMCLIGLTGGISCGKSTVSNLLTTRHKYDIIDCDLIAHKQMEEDQGLITEVIKEFGTDVLDEAGKINRTKLGEMIFTDPKKRKVLNKLTHGRIFRKMMSQIFTKRVLQWKSNVCLDAPLLFETRVLEYICYPIIVVHLADEQETKKRLM
jgi:dephospho-CoA kinase